MLLDKIKNLFKKEPIVEPRAGETWLLGLQ